MVNISKSSNGRSSGSGRGGRVEGNKVYVSNIDFSCTHQDLKDAFKQVGEVAFVEMLKDHNQKPTGCAIVRFKQPNMVEDAIRAMNRCELKGRNIVVKDERDAPRDRGHKDRKRPREDDVFDGRPTTSTDLYGNTFGLSVQFLESLGIDGPLVNRIFVANLDYNVDEDMLREVFSIAGKVLDIELVRDDDGKSKGFGFIEMEAEPQEKQGKKFEFIFEIVPSKTTSTVQLKRTWPSAQAIMKFEHPIEAVQAISMLHNQMYRDRPMSVQLTRKEKKKKDGSVKLPPGLKSIGLGLGINGAPLKDVKRTIESGNQNSLLGAMPTTQNIGSLQLNNLGMGIGSMGLPSVMPNSAMNTDLASGIRASITPSLTSDLGLSLSRGGGMSLIDRPSSNSTNYGNYSGSSQASSRNAIQISNLPSDYSWKSLQSLCMPFGDVTFAKITSRGAGIVQFDNEAAARRASDMLDQQHFEGRYLETRLL